ncbi:MAG: hypothetical protein EA379_01635 [Phycisphaerales bacterium]|nr:MAG: hypothetical protein EA379_01635 [Phycisphaerales bacterium]
MVASGAPPVAAQSANPVYVDDSPGASEAVSRARELAASGNESEAVRVLQRLLDEDGLRVIATPGDADIYISVRERVQNLLRESPSLLIRYREQEHNAAARALERGNAEGVERTRLLTTPGFEAALRVAQRRLERGKFWSAFHTLEQLDRHPDRTGERAHDAAAMLGLVVRYLDDADAVSLALRWQRDADGDAPAHPPEPVTPPHIDEGLNPFDLLRPISLEGMLARPLWSETLSGEAFDAEEILDAAVRPDDAPSPLAQRLHVQPTVAGDTIYVNTGAALHAWDRFTFTPRWPARTFTDIFEDRRLALAPQRLRLDDTNTVAASGPWVVCTTGVSRNMRREGDARVHGFDARTGEPLWSVNVATLDPVLSDSWVRGPAIIDQGVVVLAAVKQAAQRRLTSVYLVGLDVATGELLWRVLLGSAGSSPFGPSTDVADGAAVHRGVVYRMDTLGVISAVETATGRLRWVHRASPEPFRRREMNVWESHTPLVHDTGLFTLSPDRRLIMRLDTRTGARRGVANAETLGNPNYLLLSEDTLLGVSSEDVHAATVGGDELEDIRRLLRVPRPHLRGRVLVAGRRVIAPVSDGLLSIDLDARTGARSATPEHIALDRPGSVLALPDQLVVVDDFQVHTYLLWEVAERMLTERIRRDDADPTPAVTYAELAHRADRHESILPAADLAIAAIARAPGEPRSELARERFFQSALAMIDAREPFRPLKDEIAAGLIDRLGVIATGAEERVAHGMVAGAHAERRGDYARAVEAYQAMLDDPELRTAIYARAGVTLRAEVEAAQRLRRVVRTAGPGVYALFEDEARRALEALAASPVEAGAYERVAARWPVSGAAAEAMLLAAETHERAGEPERATRALEAGLLAAEDALVDDPRLLGELTGRLVLALDRAGQARAALQTFERLRAAHPELAMRERGETIDAAALRAALSRRVADLDRRASVGAPRTDRDAQLIPGWRLAHPLAQSADAPPTGHIVLTGPADELALFTVDDNSGLRHAWTLPSPGARHVRTDRDSVFVAEATDTGFSGGMRVTRIGVGRGPDAPLWSTPAFRSLFPDDPGVLDPRVIATLEGRPVLVHTPLAGPRAVTELVVVFDHRTMALIERSGRAAGFDLETGETLWTLDATIARVHDAGADAGVLVIGGANERAGAQSERSPGDPALYAIDLRTGRILHRESLQSGQVRWVRVGSDGRAYVGMDGGVECIDVHRRMVRWRVVSASMRLTSEAWLARGRLLVMDGQDSLWQIDTNEGRVRDEPLDSRSRVLRSLPINAYVVDDRVAFATPLGVVIFGAGGQVVGRDVRTGVGEVLPAALARDAFITIDADGDGTAHVLRSYTRTSAALSLQQPVRLPSSPVAIDVLDGRIVVSLADRTLVYDAPAPRPPAPSPDPDEGARSDDAPDATDPNADTTDAPSEPDAVEPSTPEHP